MRNLKRAEQNCYGKVNLYLKIGNKRSDGKHEVLTVMHKTEIHDKITIDLTPDADIVIKCTNKDVPCNENNLCYKAAKMYFEKAKYKGGAEITIEKNIAVTGGMGGGSTDCGGVLLILQRLVGVLNFDDVLEIAASLGSDIPFFLYESNCGIGTGSGEKIKEIKSNLKNIHALFVMYGTKESTGKAYAELDRIKCEKGIENNVISEKLAFGVTSSCENGDFDKLCRNIENDFEISSVHFEKVKKILMANGCRRAFLCGSGPTVCGLFESENDVLKAQKNIEFKTVISKLKEN